MGIHKRICGRRGSRVSVIGAHEGWRSSPVPWAQTRRRLYPYLVKREHPGKLWPHPRCALTCPKLLPAGPRSPAVPLMAPDSRLIHSRLHPHHRLLHSGSINHGTATPHLHYLHLYFSTRPLLPMDCWVVKSRISEVRHRIMKEPSVRL
jgi:hypothetical protein